jgi:hypothetical protein
MGISKVGAGDTVILSLKLYDQNAGKFVRAYIYDPVGALITTRDLAHVGNGLYQFTAYTMPSLDFITAAYVVYDDAGYSVPSATYQDGEDIFEIFTENLLLLHQLSCGVVVTVDNDRDPEFLITVDDDDVIDIEASADSEEDIVATADAEVSIDTEADSEINIIVEDCT